MEIDFWLQRWEKKEIGFHLSEANPLLIAHFSALSLPPGSRIFLPLCGKTRDIAWLLANGYRVAGVELSEKAIAELFQELRITPTVTNAGPLTRYSSDGIDIFVGDFFALTAELLGAVDAIYDRAALVALPDSMRAAYTRHLVAVTNNAPQLLICFEYDQNQMPGPPFSVTGAEVHRHYDSDYQLRCLASPDVAGGLKGVCPATETVWLLSRRAA